MRSRSFYVRFSCKRSSSRAILADGGTDGDGRYTRWEFQNLRFAEYRTRSGKPQPRVQQKKENRALLRLRGSIKIISRARPVVIDLYLTAIRHCNIHNTNARVNANKKKGKKKNKASHSGPLRFRRCEGKAAMIPIVRLEIR